ncbi:MAG: tetratricopeptide repeat protein [Phycisphaerae bacterium]
MMNSRQRMKRRLLLLAIGFLSLVVLGGALVMYRKHRIHEHFMLLRAQGLAAVKAKKYELALGDLGAFLGQDPTDLPSLEAYAAASLQVPQPGGRNLYQAASVIKQILYQKPNDLKYQQKLVKLLAELNYNVECVSLARQILAKHPTNLPALESESLAYGRLRKFRRAFAAANKAFQLSPDRIQNGFLALDMLYQRQLPAGTLTHWAGKLLAKAPANPVYQVLGSAAAALSNQPDQAKHLALQAAANPNLPQAVILPLVRQLDSLQLYTPATVVLEHAVRHGASVPILEALCDRLYQQGHDGTVLQLTAAKPTGHPLLLAYRARSLIRLDHPHRAARILQLLQAIKSPVADQWYAVLNLQLHPNVSDLTRMNILRTAASTFPGQPYFLDLLGSGYQHVGELELALMQWQNAARLAPTWPNPILHLAMGLVRAGHLEAAKLLVKRAAQVAPQDRQVRLAQIRLLAIATPVNKPARVTALLQSIARLERQFPGKPILLAEQIRAWVVLKQTARAQQLIAAALSARPPHRFSTLLSLYALDRQNKLGMGTTILASAEKIYGWRPRLALAYAGRLLRAKHPKQALAFLQSHRQTSGAQAPQWDLVMAEYLSATQNRAVGKAWEKAAAANADNAHAQWLALSVPNLQAHRHFILKTFARLQAIIGNSGLSWKMAKAGWLVSHSTGKKDLLAARKLLRQTIRTAPDVLLPHLLLAQINLKDGDTVDAISQLQVAAAMAPQNAGIALQLARLYQSQGDSDHARQYLQQVANSTTATPDQQRQAAALFVADGQISQAIGLLRRAQDAGPSNLGDNLILAELYQQEGRNDSAARLYQQLLKTPSAPVIAAASRFYARQGQSAKALQILSGLKSLKLNPGVADLIYGDFYADSGDAKDALTAYRTAVAAAPKNQIGWYRLLVLEMRLGDLKAVKETVRSACNALPDDKNLEFVKDNLGTINPLLNNAILRPMAVALLATPPLASAQSVVQIVGTSVAAKPKLVDFAAQLAQLAKQHPRFAALQNAAAEFLISAGHPEQGAIIALGAVRMFPASVTPARLASVAFAASHQWSQALSAAQSWAKRSAADPVSAIVLESIAYLNLAEPHAAVRTLRPYLAAALKDPAHDPGVIAAYLQSQIALHNMIELKAVLLPLLARYPTWRQFAVNIASRELPAATATLWLHRVAAATPATATAEQLQLAQGWWTLGQRVGNNADLNAAAVLLANLLRTQTLSPPQRGAILSELATVQLSAGETAVAITNYQHALKLDAHLLVAQNNLAMLLLRKTHPDLPRALALAKVAVKGAPNVAAYWDTLALVQSRMGNVKAALKSIKSAINLEPSAVQWPVDMALILVRAGDMKQAAQVLNKIDPQKVNSPQTPADIRQHYAALMRRLK